MSAPPSSSSSPSVPSQPASVRPRKSKYIKGQVIKSRDDRATPSGLTVKEWQRMPKQLISELCQREKRPRPLFASISEPGGWRGRVILPDSRGSEEKKLIFYTAEAFENAPLAEEFGCLLALHHLTPSVQHNLRFPDLLADAWKSLASAAPLVTQANKFTSQSERGQALLEKNRLNNERSNSKLDRDRHLPTLFLSEENRQAIEELLMKSGKFNQTNNLSQQQQKQSQEQKLNLSSTSAIAGASCSSSSSGDNSAVRLVSLGFSTYSIKLASNTVNSLDYSLLLDWLCLNLPECELPTRFDPRGKQLEVTQSGSAAVASRSSQVQVGHILQSILGPELLGIPKKIINDKIQRVESSQRDGSSSELAQMVLMELFSEISECKFEPVESKSAENDELLSEELTALESIFGDEFSLLDSASFPIPNSTRWKIAIELDSPFHPKKIPVEIHFLICPAINYPTQPPIINFVSNSSQSQNQNHIAPSMAFILLQFAYEIIRSDGLLSTPMVYSLVDSISHNSRVRLEVAQRILPAKWIAKPINEAEQSKSKSTSRKSAQPKHHGNTATADLNKSIRSQFAIHSASSPLREFRRSLPISSFAGEIIDSFKQNSVVIIQAATGSGKSTQVPQFLLESLINSGSDEFNIICTQPRRLSATSLCDRVSAELNCAVGDLVGYRIRLESRVSNRTRLTFVTTGVLIKVLSDSNSSNSSSNSMLPISHLLLDEAHERSVDMDFLLILIKELLETKMSNLKVAIMSATLNADEFTKYFRAIPRLSSVAFPVIRVPGRTFPVETFFLEDFIEFSNYSPPHYYRASGIKAEELKSRVAELRKSLGEKYSNKTLETMATIDEEKLNLQSIARAVQLIEQRYKESDGAILIFLPGVGEINEVAGLIRDQINEAGLDLNNYLLLPLHRELPTGEQSKIFDRPKPGRRKIVIATNIAETSITIADIKFVIDCGRAKESSFDDKLKISRLLLSWISKSAAEQRRGRSGRVSDGICFHMYSSTRFNSLASQPTPEIHRTDLSSLCLQVKLLQESRDSKAPGSCQRFLEAAIQPPTAIAIQSAIEELKVLNAIEKSEKLTAMGKFIGFLSQGSARLGKMLVLAVIFQCIEPIAVLVSFFTDRSPIQIPPAQRAEAAAALKKFESSKSDHLTLINIYNAWQRIKSSKKASRQFCSENFLNENSLVGTEKSVNQTMKSLHSLGLIEISRLEQFNSNSSNPAVLLSVLSSALYPSVIRVRSPEKKFVKIAHGSVEATREAKEFKFFIRIKEEQTNDQQQQTAPAAAIKESAQPHQADEESEADNRAVSDDSDDEEYKAAINESIRSSYSDSANSTAAAVASSSSLVGVRVPVFSLRRVFLHPSSVLFKSNSFPSAFLTFVRLVDSGVRLSVFDSSMIPNYALLLFCGRLEVRMDRGVAFIDEFICFRGAPKILALLKQLRELFQCFLDELLSDPSKILHADSQAPVQAIVKLLTNNGF